MKRIDAKTLHAWLLDGHELALLDAREEGEFGTSHLFWAVPCPLSKREIRARALLPRLAVRICCVDDGRGVAEQLATWLEGIGCTDVAVLDGGTKAWAAAGYELFSGVNVPSKAFGEWVEHHYGTESVDPPDLKSWIDAGRNIVVLDSRTHEEFVRMSIPTGDQRARRRAGLSHRRHRARSEDAGGGELRRPHAQHHGRREPAPRRHPQQGGGAAQRHDGLGAGRLPLRSRPHRPLRPRHAEDRGDRAAARAGVRRAIRRRRDRRHRSRALRGRSRPHALCAGCARSRRIPRRPPAGQHQRAGRTAGAGDRPMGRRAQRAHRAGGRHRRARPHGRRLAAPDGPSRRVRGGGRAGRDPHHRPRAPAGAGTRRQGRRRST